MTTTKERRAVAMAALREIAAARGVSFVAFVKSALPGWPGWNGPRLTTARAEAIVARWRNRKDSRA